MGLEDELTLSLNCLLVRKFAFIQFVCGIFDFLGRVYVVTLRPIFASRLCAADGLPADQSLLGQSWSNYTHTLSQQFAIIFGVVCICVCARDSSSQVVMIVALALSLWDASSLLSSQGVSYSYVRENDELAFQTYNLAQSKQTDTFTG